MLRQLSEQEYAKLAEGSKLSFLQSIFWARFRQKIAEYSAEYYAIYNGDEIIGIFLSLVKHRKILGVDIKANYVPRATFFFDTNYLLNTRLLKALFIQLRRLGVLSIVEFNYPHWEEKFVPPEKFNATILSVAREVGCEISSETIQPRSTIIKETFEKDLISSFPSYYTRKKCRRGLKRLRERRIKFLVKMKLSEDELKRAYELIVEISRRKGFKTRAYNYFKDFQETVPTTIWFLLVDEPNNNKIILANLGIIDRNTITYYDLYVGRDTNYDKMNISYLLKYYSFEYLKKIGIKYYDHWGIELNKKSPKYAYSVFKIQFGGRIITFPPQIVLGYPFLTKSFMLLKKWF